MNKKDMHFSKESKRPSKIASFILLRTNNTIISTLSTGMLLTLRPPSSSTSSKLKQGPI